MFANKLYRIGSFFYKIKIIKSIKNILFKDPITNKYGFNGHSEDFNIFKSRGK